MHLQRKSPLSFLPWPHLCINGRGQRGRERRPDGIARCHTGQGKEPLLPRVHWSPWVRGAPGTTKAQAVCSWKWDSRPPPRGKIYPGFASSLQRSKVNVGMSVLLPREDGVTGVYCLACCHSESVWTKILTPRVRLQSTSCPESPRAPGLTSSLRLEERPAEQRELWSCKNEGRLTQKKNRWIDHIETIIYASKDRLSRAEGQPENGRKHLQITCC